MFNLLLAFLFVARPVIQGKMTPELAQILHNTSDNEKILVIVHMATEYPYDQLRGMTPVEKCKVFENIALNSQREIVEYLKALPREIAEVGGQFWIFNGFHLKATKAVVHELTKRDDIWFICHNATINLEQEMVEKCDSRTPEWNITKVMAESCWANGYNGEGVIVGHISTGCDVSHPALIGKWLSPYWIDPVYGNPAPYDDLGRGTHAIGVICGGDGPGPFADDVGIAYGARYIPTKCSNSSGSTNYALIDQCMQYLANLKQSGVDIKVISNCWNSINGSDLHWWDLILNWKNLGILPVFPVGGNGPNPGTIGSPASYPTVIGVGATDSQDNIASFSSRGPAPNIYPINDSSYWYYPSWNLLKPDIAAPGVNIRSAIPNSGYATYSSTARATPHISGAAAILFQKDPELTVNELYNLLRVNCDQPPQGAPYPNNNYGWGRLNIWKALQAITGVREDSKSETMIEMSVSPNPFLHRCVIKFQIPSIKSQTNSKSQNSNENLAVLRIYDAAGRLVKDFSRLTVNGERSTVFWDGCDDSGRNLPAGVYFVRLDVDDFKKVEKVVFLR